ncbi:nmra-like family protein [Ilyonectria robusta]
MAIVAVAGGTGNVGRTLVEALVATGKHEVKILARSPNPAFEKGVGATIIPTDYTNVEATTKTLEDHGIDTVISAITTLIGPGLSPEIGLIRAADASKATKRFISTGWGIPHKEEHRAQFMTVPSKLDAWAVLKETKTLEYTIVHNGFFLDYWCQNVVKSHMPPTTVAIDIFNGAAGIPGAGNTPVTFTHTTDVAKYVAAFIDLEKWEPDTYIIGDSVTWNEFLKLAETAKGSKFDVTYDSTEKLKSGQITEIPAHVPSYAAFPKEAYQQMMATFGLWFDDGSFNLASLGVKDLTQVFPEIKPLKVKNILEAALQKK